MFEIISVISWNNVVVGRCWSRCRTKRHCTTVKGKCMSCAVTLVKHGMNIHQSPSTQMSTTLSTDTSKVTTMHLHLLSHYSLLFVSVVFVYI